MLSVRICSFPAAYKTPKQRDNLLQFYLKNRFEINVVRSEDSSPPLSRFIPARQYHKEGARISSKRILPPMKYVQSRGNHAKKLQGIIVNKENQGGEEDLTDHQTANNIRAR